MPLWLMGLIVLAVSYGFFALFAFVTADNVLFQPRPPSYDDSLPGFLRVPGPDGVDIAAVHLPNPSARYTIIYFHGNAEDLGYLHERLEELQARGFAAVGFDSRGYGLTPGEPGEQALHEDAAAVYRHVRDALGVPPERIIAYGFSLGAGGAVELARHEPVAGLVVQAGFTSAFRTVTGVPLLPWDRFRNIDKLPHVKCPVLVMHGRRDGTIPFSHGPNLFAAANEPKRSLWVDDAAHNNFLDRAGPRYWDALAEFVALVDRTQQARTAP